MGVQPERKSSITWRKSSRSADQGNCVEVATEAVFVLVRDSRGRSGPVVAFTQAQWRQLLRCLRSGELN
jgi:hypothetical protein